MKKIKFLILPLLALSLTACSLDNIYDLIFNGGDSSSVYVDSDYSQPELTSLENTESKKDVTYTMAELNKHSAYNTPVLPSTGNPNILVIPTWFKDSGNHIQSNNKARIKSDIEKAYFGSDKDNGWKSVQSYYLQASYGKLKISGKVTDWWECGVNGSTISDTGVDLLVEKAAKWYKTNNSDIEDYDYDHDGYIDCICLIYAYPNSYDDNDTLWAYCYWLQDSSLRNAANPGPNTYFWASYDFMYSSGGGDNRYCSVDSHTYIHEMGHVLGLDDYYDYACTKTYNNAPAGGFSMQDYNVGDHDPFSKMVLGWVNPYVPTSSCTINIHDFESSGDIIVLTPNWVGSSFDEYIIIELYTPKGLNTFDCTHKYGGDRSGYPKGPSAAGIRIWHVDARLMYVTNGEEDFSSTKISNTISNGKFYAIANSNTTYTSSTKDYASEITSFRNFNLLQLLRNNQTASYAKGSGHTTGIFTQSDMWFENSSFSISSYKNQFYNSNKLNNGNSLSINAKFSNISNSTATITITM